MGQAARNERALSAVDMVDKVDDDDEGREVVARIGMDMGGVRASIGVGGGAAMALLCEM